MRDLTAVGGSWLGERIDSVTEAHDRVEPVDFIEANRYLSSGESPIPGPFSFDNAPHMREPVSLLAPWHPAREVNVLKGVQVQYTSAFLENAILYYAAHLRHVRCMLLNADKELATERVDMNIIPMLNSSGFGDIIQSADVGNTRKTGKTAKHLQWVGGGSLIPQGATNANKMRQWSVLLMLKDELDAWLDYVGKDGCPDAITDDRCAAFWAERKIVRGSTPLIKGQSKIWKQFLRGDQRRYNVRCRSCSYPQDLRWSGENAERDFRYGFAWELERGQLIHESVRYRCKECGHGHFEHDKPVLFSAEGGAKWVPTATPAEKHVYSYHIPAMLSPLGIQPWYKCVAAYLAGWDTERNRVRDIGLYQRYYNNIIAMPFEIRGGRVKFEQVSGHRRPEYSMGEVPNDFAAAYCGGKVVFLTMQVDCHDHFLAVSVKGWTVGARCILVDYQRLTDPDSEAFEDGIFRKESPVWAELTHLIEEQTYTADDGRVYHPLVTGIDAGYRADFVTEFCDKYESGVYPLIGGAIPKKRAKLQEFSEFKTRSGTHGYRILVDHYKDRLASVLRRDWHNDQGVQPEYHFNAPVDTTDAQLKELTVERRVKEVDKHGVVTYRWHRPGNARNELWDLFTYGSGLVEIYAWSICIQHFGLDTVDWNAFWGYMEEEQVGYELLDEVLAN